MPPSLIDRVRETVAATLSLPIAAVDLAASADNTAAWDSLAQVNLMLAIEQTFGVELEVDDFASLTSIRGITEHLAAKGVG